MRAMGAKRGALHETWSDSVCGGMRPQRSESARSSDWPALPMEPLVPTTKMTRRQRGGSTP